MAPLRRALDGLYDAAAALAALAMVGLLLAVLASIFGRQAGINLPGIDAYAGYLMAAAGFLALAHTFKRGEHIRVTLLIGRLRGGWLRGFERWSLTAAVLLAGLGAWYSVRLAWQSHAFNDISTSNDATPLWIPQLAMAVGNLVFLIALVDELVLEWTGRRATAESSEAARHE